MQYVVWAVQCNLRNCVSQSASAFERSMSNKKNIGQSFLLGKLPAMLYCLSDVRHH